MTGTDHGRTIYYEALRDRADPDLWRWKVYRYDPGGTREISLARSDGSFADRAGAIDAAADWCEENGIVAELA